MPISVDDLRGKLGKTPTVQQRPKSFSRKLPRTPKFKGIKTFLLANAAIPFASSVAYAVATVAVPRAHYSQFICGISLALLTGAIALPKFNWLWVRLSIGFLASQVSLVAAILSLQKIAKLLGGLVK